MDLQQPTICIHDHHEDIHTGSLVTTTKFTDIMSTTSIMAASDPSTQCHTTNSPSNTTPQTTTIKDTTMTMKTESNPHFTDSPTVTIGPQSKFNVDKVTPTSEESTSTPAVTYTVTVPAARMTNSPTIASADSGHEGLTTGATQHPESTIAAGKITTQLGTDTLPNLITETASISSPSVIPSRQNELHAEQDNTLQNASQDGLLQVAISSLVVLGMMCITVYAIMVTVFTMACKRNRAQFTYSRGRDKKLLQASEAHSETQEAQEYSFM